MRRTIKYVFILLLVLLFLILIASAVGSASLGLKETSLVIVSLIPGLRNLIDADALNEQSVVIISKIRLPRIFMSIAVGIALASAGVIFQGIFRNPMADPYIIGVSAGASFGATIGLLFTTSIRVLNISATNIFAFVGAIAATFIVYNISRIRNKTSVLTLLLAGVALSALFSAINSFIYIFRSHDLAKVIFWLMGGLTASSWQQLSVTGPIVLVLLLITGFFMKDLNLISLGDERAAQLGVNIDRVKVLLLVLASLSAAAAVSVAGIIGFVGLITPHIVRIIVGPDHRILYPTSAIAGAVLLLGSDTIARMALSPREIPVGIITSVIGVPFFIYLLMRSKKKVF
jgi:iron complex transport system permease protein